MHKTVYIICTGILLNVGLIFNACPAQENKIAITLEESISYGLKNSYRMRLYRQWLDQSEKSARATKAGLKSYLDVTTNLPHYSMEVEDIKDINGVTHYAHTKNLKYQSTLSFHQPLPTSGHFSLNYDFYYHQQKENIVNYSNDIFIRFTQPIFTSNRIKRSIRWAENNLARDRANFVNRQFDYVHDVITRFYQFYRAELSVKLQKDEIQQRKISYEDAKQRFENGELAEHELLNLEVELLRSEAQYYSLIANRNRHASYFKTLIGLPYDTEITPIADLRYTSMEIDIAKAIDLGLDNSPDVLSSLYWIEWEKIFQQYVGTWSEFKGNIYFTYGLEKIDPSFRYSYRGFDQSRSIMLNFSIPLWDWGKQDANKEYSKSRLKSAELRLLLQQQRVTRTIRNTARRIEETIRRLNNLKNIEKQAQRSYELARDKFLKRKLSVNELLLTMEQWSTAQGKYIDAIINYELSKAQLTRLTQWDFEKNQKVKPLNGLTNLESTAQDFRNY